MEPAKAGNNVHDGKTTLYKGGERRTASNSAEDGAVVNGKRLGYSAENEDERTVATFTRRGSKRTLLSRLAVSGQATAFPGSGSAFETEKKQDAVVLKKVVGATDDASDSGTRGDQLASWLAVVVADSGKKKEEAAVGVALGMGKEVLSLFLNENKGELWNPTLNLGLDGVLEAQPTSTIAPNPTENYFEILMSSVFF
ncbi:hypothetical protein PIB30_095801 [Stylosanthes scabra]|uniref:Uncharacterized protein n=1 Tax=Stylosanthes scabra TaxID=79078 RepID=A0ABU6QVT2_9FABA|nr:hypothetical protein [Stylosanthes scabra]